VSVSSGTWRILCVPSVGASREHVTTREGYSESPEDTCTVAVERQTALPATRVRSPVKYNVQMNIRIARPRTLCLTLVATLACGVPAVSQETASPAYNIEVVIFRATTAQGGAENWSAETGAANSIAGDEEASSGSSQVGHFVGIIPSSAYQLTEIENRLRSSGAYVPVAHVAWSQTASAWGTRAGFTLQKLGVEATGLSGTVFLERGQYLHLGMTLTYADPAPPAGLGAAAGTTFTINQSRRVRFYERNYYDHPAFGVVALVSPAQGARPPGR
jgi:Peptidoglycan-binding protein, CsiV